MKGNEEDQLANALKEQIELDKDLESIRIDLALRRDFNLLDTFKFFDLEGAGSIGKRDLKNGLNELSVFPTNDELYLVLRKFDKDNDGLLRFSDLSEILTPKDAEYAEVLNKREAAYTQGGNLNDVFSEQTIFLLKKLLNKVISNEAYSESIRQRLNRRPLFNLWEAFKALDRDNNGFISSFEFKDMLVDHGFFPSQKEISSLVDRYDKNQDGKISYSEFIQEITPKSPQKY